MNRINGVIAGLSFLSLLSVSGYAEMDKMPMEPTRYSRCSRWRYSPSVRTGQRTHEKRRCQDGNPDQRQRKIYSTT